jgi:hypothetical protein
MGFLAIGTPSTDEPQKAEAASAAVFRLEITIACHLSIR